mmetsp:Transcript_2692/g.8223  ORF Transcript_2692/g.8223 Transcript_2692/m.8223 type:complete len:210 (+) Transcript_2692:103-732(+)
MTREAHLTTERAVLSLPAKALRASGMAGLQVGCQDGLGLPGQQTSRAGRRGDWCHYLRDGMRPTRFSYGSQCKVLAIGHCKPSRADREDLEVLARVAAARVICLYDCAEALGNARLARGATVDTQALLLRSGVGARRVDAAAEAAEVVDRVRELEARAALHGGVAEVHHGNRPPAVPPALVVQEIGVDLGRAPSSEGPEHGPHGVALAH